MVKLFSQDLKIFTYFNFIILIFYLILSLFILNMWDAYHFDYAFNRENLDGLKLWAIENSHRCFLYIINSLFFMKKKFQFSNEILFDLFNFISLFLFIYQISNLGKIFLKLDTQWKNLVFTIVLIFPVWEGFTSLPLGFYLFYFSICLLGFRLFFYSESLIKVFFGFFLLINSLCVQSNYSLIVGLIICHLIISKINKQNITKSLFIFITILFIFIINYFYFPAYNYFEDFNRIELNNIAPKKLLSNTFNFLTFFIYFIWVFVLLIYLNIKNRTKNLLFISKKNFFIILVLFIFSTGPYLFLNKSTDVFAWKDYLGRHAYLMSIPFAFFFTLLFQKIYEIDSSNKKKFFFFFITVFILQALSTQIFKFYFKIEASVFHESFVKNLQKFEKPKSGIVEFYTINEKKFDHVNKHDYLPGHRMRNHEVAALFYKAYGEASWLFFIPKSKSNKSLDFEKYKTLFNADEFNIDSKCKTKITFSKQLNYFERFKYLYIFNSEKYYKIKKIVTSCS